MHEPNQTHQDIETTTVNHYEQVANRFWEGTKDHDVSQNRQALLRHIQGETPYRILDFGCGPGRDLAVFKNLGHEPFGLDGSPSFCRMAQEFAKCEVWNQNFLKLDLPQTFFDGVFANASLFHVPSAHLPRVLGELRASLKPGGVLFASNPRGNNDEGWQNTRYGVWHDEARWQTFVTQAGFAHLETYFRPPGKPRHEQPWLATLWRKPQE